MSSSQRCMPWSLFSEDSTKEIFSQIPFGGFHGGHNPSCHSTWAKGADPWCSCSTSKCESVNESNRALFSCHWSHTEDVSQFGFLTEISPIYCSPGISLQLRFTAAVKKTKLLPSFCPTSVNRTNPFSFSFVSSHEDRGVPIPVTEMA